MESYKLVTLIFALILLGCFAYQVSESLDRYFSRKTTMLSSTDSKTPGEMPILTFCPGLKTDSDTTYGSWLIRKSVKKFYQEHAGKISEETVAKYWEDLTYGPEELFVSLGKTVADTGFASVRKIEISEGYHETVNATISDVSTQFGRCYSIKFWGEFSAKQYVGVQVSWNYSQDILMFIHQDEFNQLGLNLNSWPTPALNIDLVQEVMMDVYLKREKYTYLPDKEDAPCVDDINYNQAKCAYDWIQKAYLTMNCTSICWYPGSQYTTKSLNIPLCRNQSDLMCSMDAHQNLLRNVDATSVTKCLPSCHKLVYQMSQYRFPKSFWSYPNETYFFLSFETLEMESHEEYLIFNLSSIVSAVGGSLGLFLGFSFLGVIEGLMARLASLKFKNVIP